MFRSFVTSEITTLNGLVFDPANNSHVMLINSKIDSFMQTASKLVKVDLMISVPVAALIILFLSVDCGLIRGSLLLGLCGAFIYKTDAYKTHTECQATFQRELEELVDFYQACVKKSGYQVTANETISKLLACIAPYVETNVLFTMGSTDENEYPANFKKILSTPPHRIPFADAQVEVRSSSYMSYVSNTVPSLMNAFIATAVQNADSGSNNHTTSAIERAWVLSKKVGADIHQSIYSLNVDKSFSKR